MDAYDLGEAVRDACPRWFRQTLLAGPAFGLMTHAGWATFAVTASVQHKTDSAVEAVTTAFKHAFPVVPGPPPATGQSPEQKD